MYFGRPSVNDTRIRIVKRVCDESVSTSSEPAGIRLVPTGAGPATTEAPRPRIRSRFRLLFYSLELLRCAAALPWKAERPASLPCILPAQTVEPWRSQPAFAALAGRPPSARFRRELARFPARRPECLSLFRYVREGHREVFARWPGHSSIAPRDLQILW